MAHEQEEASPFTGFGLGTFARPQDEGGVFILAVYRDGSLTASAHASERGAMAAAIASFEDERDDEEESGTPEDRFAQVQRLVSDEGGAMEIIAGPVHGG